MTREPDERARRLVLPLGEKSTLTIDAFPGYAELVELHVEFIPGTRAAGHPGLDLAAIVERYDAAMTAIATARWMAEDAVESADELEALLGRHLIKPLSRDVDEVTKELLQGRTGELILTDARMQAARRARRRSTAPIEKLREICAHWDEVYDDYVGREGERRVDVAKRFGMGERRLSDALRDAKRAGLKYRGMR
jgi:hypothetical protein